MATNEGTQNGTTGQEDIEQDAEAPEVNHEAQQERMARLEQGQILGQLMADPEVRAVIEAKRAGRAVKVTPAETEETEKPADVLDGLEADDPSRQVLSAMQDMLKAQLEPLTARLAAVEDIAGDVQKRDVREQVIAAKTKFKDLDQYKDEMVKLAQQHQGLNPEQLYLLAKNAKGKLRLAETTTFSEKPTQQPQRPRSGAAPTKPPARPTGRNGFSQMLNQALEGLDLNALGKDD